MENQADVETLEEAEHGPEISTRLTLPSDSLELWAQVDAVLRGPIDSLSDLDTMLTKLRAIDPDRPQQACTFFASIPGSAEAGKFDFDEFFAKGVPLMIEVALEMPKLFEGVEVPIFKMRSSWNGPACLGKKSFTLSRRQCACLLAHSFFGSLQRPPDVQRNDFRFTVSDLFMGTAVSPNSATTFANYFTMLAKHGIPDGMVTIERLGFQKGAPPWQWEENAKPLCRVEFVVGAIEDSLADCHVEFANAFIGGGVMTGDAAMEEIVFLVKPELMVAMALQNRMIDEEAICVLGALQYSLTSGYGASLAFAGDCDRQRDGAPTKVCAIDAVRGGSNLERRSLLRDLNKARIAFEGVKEVATGHWGCGAYGNNEDLMFLKQWMAASEAGVQKMIYHDRDKKHSHHNFQLERKLRHMTVGHLWDVLCGIEPCTVGAFCKWVDEIASGRHTVVGDATKESKPPSVSRQIPTVARLTSATQSEVPSNGMEGIASSAVPADEAPSFTTYPGSLEGQVVMYKGVEMTCIKQNAAQVRLRRADGTTTWASKKDVTFT